MRSLSWLVRRQSATAAHKAAAAAYHAADRAGFSADLAAFEAAPTTPPPVSLPRSALGRSPDWQNPKRPYFSTLSHIDSGKERMLSATQAFKRLRVSK